MQGGLRYREIVSKRLSKENSYGVGIIRLHHGFDAINEYSFLTLRHIWCNECLSTEMERNI